MVLILTQQQRQYSHRVPFSSPVTVAGSQSESGRRCQWPQPCVIYIKQHPITFWDCPQSVRCLRVISIPRSRSRSDPNQFRPFLILPLLVIGTQFTPPAPRCLLPSTTSTRALSPTPQQTPRSRKSGAGEHVAPRWLSMTHY